MKTKYIIGCLASLLLVGCKDEQAFTVDAVEGEGVFSKQALLMDVRDDSESIIRSSRGEFDDFKILFYKNESITPEKTYTYSEMPDVVVLPVGHYTVTAKKGEDVDAGWESPYYLGNSETFEIKQDEITSDIDPIVCKLENVKVTVDFDPMLEANMTDDSYVEVKVGDNSGLRYTKDKEGVAGHFKHSEGVTMVAEFNGIVEGQETKEIKHMAGVKKGHHYKIKFKLHSQDGEHAGEADATVQVDASVTVVNLENNIVIGEDEDLGDDERPTEGEGPGIQPDDAPPVIEAVAPIDLGKVNDIEEDMPCVLNVTSTAEGGFTKFECDIDSDKLNETELTRVGLAAHLDLITPGSLEEALVGLNLPVNVGGQHSVKFDLTSFLPWLSALGSGTHNFVLTVGDANGETTKTLILRQN